MALPFQTPLTLPTFETAKLAVALVSLLFTLLCDMFHCSVFLICFLAVDVLFYFLCVMSLADIDYVPVATRDIPADTVLFTIPRKSIINVETSALKGLLPQVFEEPEDDETPHLDSWSSLILVMMYEFLLGVESAWKPYFDVLPCAFDTPMFWSADELSHLQASATASKVGKDTAEEMFHSLLIPVIRANPQVFAAAQDASDHDLITLAHRMGSTIMAYAFDLENDEGQDDDDDEDGWVEDRDGKALMGMVPMADIMNADAEFNVS